MISKVKKEEWVLDESIPKSYFLNFVMNRIIMAIRGLLVFKKINKRAFIGKNSIIKCRQKITYGTNFTVGINCFIDALSYEGILAGNNVSIGKNTTIECTGSLKEIGRGLVLGDNVGIGSHSFLGCAGGIVIGSDTIIGNFVSFHSENHNYEKTDIPIRLQGVNRRGIKVGDNCWIGAKVTLLDGAEVGNGCIIAAGSVVKAGQYADNAIYGGVPAKFIKPRF